MGVQQRRERERQARRRAILDATRALVREHGFGGTTTKQIARDCELSEATLFWYFKNKDELFLSLLDEGIEFLRHGLERLAGEDLPPRDRLRRVWEFFGEVHAEHPEYFHVFGYLSQPRATSAISVEVRDEVARRSGDNFRLFSEVLEQAGVGHDPRLVADLIWGAFVGLTLLRDSRANLGARPRPGPRERARVFELLLGGITR